MVIKLLRNVSVSSGFMPAPATTHKKLGLNCCHREQPFYFAPVDWPQAPQTWYICSILSESRKVAEYTQIERRNCIPTAQIGHHCSGRKDARIGKFLPPNKLDS